MSFERAFKVSSYLLLISGFNVLFTASAVGLPLTLFCAAALAVHWRVGDYPLTRRMQALIFCAFLLLFLADLALVSGLVGASVHLLILISLVKIFTVKSNRDYLLIYCISFTFLLIGSTYTISILFLLSLIVYFFFGILTFILFESKSSYEENRAASFSLRSYAQVAALITGMIITLSIPIFLAVPRTALGFLKTSDGLGPNMSGFSDHVNLGDIGRVIANRAVFMRVGVDRPLTSVPLEVKWRGIALDHFDGHAWSNTEKEYQRIPMDPFSTTPGQETAKRFLLPMERRREESLLAQTITVEHSSRIIFGADRIVQVAGSRIPDADLLLDRNDTVSFLRNPAGSVRYTVHSDISSRAQKLSMTNVPALPADLRERYLQLPPLDPRVRELARRLTYGQSDPASKALALESNLSRSYSYSLENRPASSPDPLADFLFETRAGHCEYFATALAVTLRVVGIPSRVVNGFRRGEYNAWSGYFIVRSSDAHSWVEAYLPGAGWVDLDATPVSIEPESFYLAMAAGQFLDAVDVFWTEVITFDRLKQISFFVSMGSNLRRGIDKFAFSFYRLDHIGRRWARDFGEWEGPTPWQIGFGLLTLGVSIGAWINRRRLARFWKRTVLRKSPSELAPDYYLELLEILRRKGFVRLPAETPSEFATRVCPLMESTLPALITQYYYRSRYGNIPLEGRDLANVRRGLNQLRTVKRKVRDWAKSNRDQSAGTG